MKNEELYAPLPFYLYLFIKCQKFGDGVGQNLWDCALPGCNLKPSNSNPTIGHGDELVWSYE